MDNFPSLDFMEEFNAIVDIVLDDSLARQNRNDGEVNMIGGGEPEVDVQQLNLPQLPQPGTSSQAMANQPEQSSHLFEVGINDPDLRTKEWHPSISNELRCHLLHKLIQSVFPIPELNEQVMLDERMQNIVRYCQRVESDTFKAANSRPEYYHILAKKIYDIQTKLEEKRLQRISHHQVGKAVSNSQQ